MFDPLSARRREALRLDLEDQQKALIEEVYRLSRGLIHGSGVPQGFSSALLAGEPPETPGNADLAARLDAEVQRLREISRTLGRIGRPDFGCCERCGNVIPFADLAVDATRRQCSGGCGH